MKRYIFCSLFVIFMFNFTFAQKEKVKLNDRHYIGGSLGLQFGSVVNININPHYGFYIANRFSAGLGGSYQYYKNSFYNPPFKLNIYGGSAFCRFDIIDELFLQAEYELLYYETDIYSPMRQNEKIYAEGVLGGLGYRQFVSSESFNNVYIMLLYNFNETQFTPYSNPVLRFGLEFYF
jgi:hypothetical protein